MTTVGAQDAQSDFGVWLNRVERGEELVITRDGSPVARLVPATCDTDRAARSAAIAELQEIARRNRLQGLSVKELAAEGRR